MRPREDGLMPGSLAMTTPPMSEASTDAPNLLIRLIRERPDAAARAAIVAVACTLFWLTWAHWGDIQLDNGRELYVPMQILRGELLYRDIFYAFGPLAPYGEAILLGIFGQHFYVLYVLGFATMVADALLLFNIGLMVEGRAVGLTAALTLLLQGFQSSSFNYVFPWSYAGSLGLLLSLFCAFFTFRRVLGRKSHDLILAGLAAGLALLSKQEFGAACYILLAFVLLTEATLQRSVRTLLHGIALCTPGGALWVVVYGWFFWTLTPRFMVFYNWIELPGSYYMRAYGARWAALTGLRFIPLELGALVLCASVALVLWYLIARMALSHIGRWSFAAAVALLALATVALRQLAPMTIDMVLTTFIFPDGMFFIGCGFFAYTLHSFRHDSDNRCLFARTALGGFALVLAIRVMAKIVPVGYTIFYDGPLLLVFTIVVTKCISAAAPVVAAEKRRQMINSLLTAEVIMLAIILVPIHSERTVRLVTSWGPIYLEPADASTARQIIDFVSEQTRHGRRVALLPELPIVYAFTGTEAPSRWYTLIPGSPSPDQERDYISDLRRFAPDYIVLTNRYTGEYGPAYFGIDYDRRIVDWIEANYRITSQFGYFRRDRSRILAALLYQRRRESPDVSHAPSLNSSYIGQK
jgi:hypothetical protein